MEHLASIYEATKNSTILWIIGAVLKISVWTLVILGVIVLTLVVVINNTTRHRFTPWRFSYDAYELHDPTSDNVHISDLYFFPLLHRYSWYPLVTVSAGGNWHPTKTTRHTVDWYYGFAGFGDSWSRQLVGIGGGNRAADHCQLWAYLTTIFVYSREESVTDY